MGGYIPERVLVTGGAGFIGSHICDRLVEMGIEVVCADNLITGSKDNTCRIWRDENRQAPVPSKSVKDTTTETQT